VEGYPCDPTAPISAEEAFSGTVAMFARAGFLVAATAAWASEGLDTSLHDAGSVRATRLMRPAAQ
jgi:hypothetical protein